ncbi:hypothetical protein ACM25N_02385 [Roseovarius sp. C7]|uniref:hypothetical protein n=1 Tax=Roseovarius sp. C7 TaxID=3398643 RepID=UPI0039F4AB10
MAYTTQHQTAAPEMFGGVLAAIHKALSAVGHLFLSFGEQTYRLHELQELQKMSDEQLAARNLKREDIVHHIFSYQHVG